MTSANRHPCNRPRAERGFTLVELLVILVVLGVIVVAAIPSINRYLPRYRMERVAENLTQAVRVARHGAVTKHANHVLRFWADQKRTVPAAAGGTFLAFDILVDRNNNMVEELPPAGTDAVLLYPPVSRDVVGHLDPDGGAGAIQPPYPSFPDAPSPLVFRQDGQIYQYSAGDFVALGQAAFLVESLILPDANYLTAQKATYKFRWVELDRLGAVRLVGLRRF